MGQTIGTTFSADVGELRFILGSLGASCLLDWFTAGLTLAKAMWQG